MKYYILLLFAFFTIASTAQKNNKAYKISYSRSSNGKTIEGQDPILVFSDSKETIITSENNISGKADFPFEETFVNSVKGQIKASQLGMTLIHEHVLVELWPN